MEHSPQKSVTDQGNRILQNIATRALDIDQDHQTKGYSSDSNYEISQSLLTCLYQQFGLPLDKFIFRENLNDLLHSNNLHFRKCVLNKKHRRAEQGCFLARSVEDQRLVLVLPYGTKKRIYSPHTDSYITIKSAQLMKHVEEYGLEIYPMLSPEVGKFRPIFWFCFTTIQFDLFKALLLSIVLTLLGLCSPLITSHVVGDVVPSGDIAYIISAFIVSILLALYRATIAWVQSFYLIRVSQKLSLRIELALYKRLLSYPVDFIESYTAGDLSSRLKSISNVISELSSSTLSSLIQSLSLIAFGGMMFYYDAQLAFAGVCVVVVATLVDFALLRRQLKYQKVFVDSSADLYNTTLQSLSSVAQIRTNANEPYILGHWFDKILKISDLSYASARLSDFNSAISSFVGIFGSAVIYSVLITQILNQNSAQAAIATAGSFIVFSSAYSSFSSNFAQFVGFINTLCGSLLIDFNRGAPMIRQLEEQSFQADSRRVELVSDIKIDSLSFSYPNSKKVVPNNLSCTIRAGKFNVVFGPSGCGKSTLISLLLRFYRGSQGDILIEGQSIDDLDLDYYRAQIGAVLQSPSMPAVSIKESLTSGLEVDESIIWNTLHLVNIAEEIDALPMKLETILSEGASNISGGQRQRLCIARALLRNPRILLEDEATSALDQESQAVIINNLRALGLTRIVVAHRISAITDCDHMIVLNADGTLDVEGSFEYCRDHSEFLRRALYAS